MQAMLDHVDIAYEQLKADLEKYNRVSVNMSVGLGKSIIAEYVVMDNPDKRILIMTPTKVISKSHSDNMETYCNGGQNTRILCYHNMRKLLHEKDAWDYVILDEYHHLGGVQWKEYIDTIIKNNPNCKFIGTTATPVRADGFNMSEEIFEKNSVEITMLDAIQKGLLPKIKCNVAVYDIQKEISKLEDEYNESGVTDEKCEKILRDAKHQAENASNLSDFFDNVIPEHHGKYIVFCQTKTQMNDMKARCKEWFPGVDVETYSVYYRDNPKHIAAAFNQFENADASNKIVLMFNINMISEGYHKDIDGVILFRTTSSIVKYTQQIGRTLDIHWKMTGKIPRVIDVVDTVEDLKLFIDISRGSNSLNPSDRIYDIMDFEVYDNDIQIIDVLNIIHDIINPSFTIGFNHTKEYYEEYGNINVPHRYKSPDGYGLGYWICAQRMAFNSDKLSQDRINCLESIGMVWNAIDEKFDIGFNHAKEYYETYGNLNIPSRYKSPDGYGLGYWICAQRTASNSGKLSQDRINRLESIGMVWSNSFGEKFDIGFNHAKEYYEEYGNLNIPYKYKSPDGYKLGHWISDKMTAFNSGKLSQDKIDRFESIGIVWNNSLDKKIDIGFNHAKEYYSEHGNLNVPYRYKSLDGYKLGHWITCQRSLYNSSKLSQDRINRLESIGMTWTIFGEKFDIGFNHAKEYYETYGNLNIPSRYKSPDGYKLGYWIVAQRLSYNSGKLSQDRINRLESIGMVWSNSFGEKFDIGFNHAKEYYEEYGNLNIPSVYESPDGYKLGRWICAQRMAFNSDKLSQDRINRLESIGMVWSIKPRRNKEGK